MRVLNVFPQTKPDGEINPPFLSNEHGDPRFFFQVFAYNTLIKNIFEEEKSLIVEHEFLWKTVPYWVYFGQGEDFKLTTELFKKLHYSYNKAIKNGVNEAILLM